MKQDTKMRIEQYNSRLPRLKERVIATVSLLLVSVIMLTTASLAWITMSVNPEVSNVSTSIASNGNLEIALASGTRSTLTPPGPTQLGDGDLPILSGNRTWGNLINLSDPAYGLSNLVLRPAGLNKDDLLGSPLYGADYIASGKQEGYIDSFRYATWQSTNADDPSAPWEFVISDELGVRAISSTIMAESSGFAYAYQVKLDEAKAALREAQNGYLSITHNVDIITGQEKPFLEALATVMGAYMTANMNASQEDNEHLINATMDKASIEALRDLFAAFIRVLEYEQEAIRLLANLELFVLYKGASDAPSFATVEALIARKDNLTFAVPNDAGTTTNVKLQLSGLNENITDMDKLVTNHAKLVDICNKGGEIKWKDDGLGDIVNALVTVGTCTVNGTRVSSIGASAALDLNNKTCATVITNGVLYNFEKRTGARMDVPNGTTALEQKYPKGLPVTAKGKRLGFEMNGTIYALITTNAPSPSLFQKDLDFAESKNTGGAVALTANDTYGFAVDFWVRTNASGSYLILEGNVLTETIEEDVKGTDAEGSEVQLYVAEITQTDPDTQEEVTYTVDVYEKNGTWYVAETHEEFTYYDASNPPKKKVNIVQNVIGYEGENRVWEDNAFLSTDSTTQGSGSCYVYYYETPEDMERSLKLLSAMNIAFVDAEGTLLAEGYMDTNSVFDDNGKVTVPMRLDAKSITLTNADGSETLAITHLEKNVAKLVTAIVYLDGTKVENQDVLAVSEIQGQMNIQFGSSVDLNSVPDENLASKYMSISTLVDKSHFDYDESIESGTPMEVTVNVKIDGSKPNRVSAFFMRAISSTQGIPMNGEDQIMNFTDRGEGVWASTFTFDSPGTYVMRSVWIDGVEYDIEPDDRPTIVVEGFNVRSLRWESTLQNERSFMTAANSVSDNLVLEFVTSDVDSMPTTVEGRFIRTDGNSVNVTFKRSADNNSWVGGATFLSSGVYTLEYLVFDGEYYPVDSSMHRVANVNLGMKTAVYTDSPLSFLFGYGIDGDPSNGMEDNEENLYMKIKITDDTGNEMKGLNNVKLYYSLAGSVTEVNGLDANMEWNPSTEYYEGEFHTKPGVFQFLYVTVGDNVIKTATTSPRFIIQSPTPPSFNTGNAESWQYKPDYNNDPAKISVFLNDTDGIDESCMIGVISDGTTEHKVNGKNAGNGEWLFTVPTKQGSQDGTWTLTRIEIVGIFYDGDVTTEDDPFLIDLAGEENLTTTVLSTIKIKMDKETNIDFSGVFLEEHTLTNELLGGLTISDKNGGALPGMADTVQLVYTYGKDSVAKGGYSINFSAPETITVTLKKDANGKYFLQDAAALAIFKYAGTYKLTSLSFNFTGGPVTLTGADLPKAGVITITSTAPSVKITARSNYNSSSNTDTTATVYFGSSSGTCGTNYQQPSVTITLSGIGNATGATMTFVKTGGGNVLLYTSGGGTTPTSTYSWSTNGTCQRYVGYYKTVSAGTDEHTAAGELKSSELVLTDSAGTYIVSVDITINNPS